MSADRDDILKAAAHGNAHALDFLRVFARRAHWVDDLCDQDRREEEGGGHSAARLAQMESEWLLTLLFNPFVRDNSIALGALMTLALNAWVDSEGMRNAERGTGNAADVVKAQWHEVVWFVALRTGGWQHLRATSSEFRSYDFDPTGANGENGENVSVSSVASCSTGKGVHGTVRT